ncbi:Hypothetical predicted protein [Marmota monax]|uniref:Uncharacterized protein n=1 Tax=Marmota monax TaxID=9995 RepID=A0A5E4B1I1_MARMO|nr:Hypothetical predicted protein [Marmota monax]
MYLKCKRRPRTLWKVCSPSHVYVYGVRWGVTSESCYRGQIRSPSLCIAGPGVDEGSELRAPVRPTDNSLRTQDLWNTYSAGLRCLVCGSRQGSCPPLRSGVDTVTTSRIFDEGS